MLEFLTKFEFLNKIFKRGESRNSAKERLQLVLIHDRASITPKVMESLKEDLISVISRYLEIDVSELEIGLEQKEGSIALAANIPIKKVRRNPIPRDRVVREAEASVNAEEQAASSTEGETGLPEQAASSAEGETGLPEQAASSAEGETGLSEKVASSVEVEARLQGKSDTESPSESIPETKKTPEPSHRDDEARISLQERKKTSTRSKRRSKMKRLSEVKKRKTSADQENTKGE